MDAPEYLTDNLGVEERIALNTNQLEIAVLLHTVNRPRSYCTHGHMTVPMPQLQMDPVETIAGPIQPAQIRVLIEAADRAPHDRGPETMLTSSGRHCWQIGPASVLLRGPDWSKAFQ